MFTLSHTLITCFDFVVQYSLIQIKTDASQSHHRDLPLANQNQSRSQQNYNPYIYIYYYVDTNICRTSVLGKPVNTGKP